jgi:hypothetical protein
VAEKAMGSQEPADVGTKAARIAELARAKPEITFTSLAHRRLARADRLLDVWSNLGVASVGK